MFWNSAAAAAAPGFNTESHATLVLPDSEITATGGLFPFVGFGDESGDIGDGAVVPASYANYQLTDRLFLGLGINSPYGFTTKPDNTDWAGSPIGITTSIFTINVNPTLAYKLTPELTVGVGAQAQYTKVRRRDGAFDLGGGFEGTGHEVEVEDFGFGYTAGVSYSPTPGTTIGIGFRSAIHIDAEGDCKGAGLSTFIASGGASPDCTADVTAKATLPELVSLGLRHQATDKLAVLGTVEWTNWSRLNTIYIKDEDTGETQDILPLNYRDGWFYSVGVEYAYSPFTTLRAGIAYEESPITDETRNVFLPDNERIWVSIGATHKYSEKITIDVAYTHIFVEDAPITFEIPGQTLLEAEADSQVDILSASVRYKISGGEGPLEPLK
jgi:long-chain fatty acid transport protein